MATESAPEVKPRRESNPPKPKALKPFDSHEIKVLLLENVNQTAVDLFKAAGYQIEYHSKALPTDVLKEKIKDFHAVGIRSKTKLTEEVLREAKNLVVIGAFCIGTNQIDLEYAAKRGIAVFNSPFSNSRSVAEMVLGEVIALSRQLGERNKEMHDHKWNKVSSNCFEIRGKTLGIIGYGHIGSQLSVLAEAMGMVVIFFDVLQIMPLGTARPVSRLEDLLKTADFVTLHVPETPETKNMIGAKELAMMKPTAYLINASRGTVVDIPALSAAMQAKKLAGCAVDVFPWEPEANGKNFKSEILGNSNTILTPHIGGSTEEAQSAIGVEVGNALIRYINSGSSSASVNFPEVELRAPSANTNVARVLNVHSNVPGVLRQINKIISDYNIEKQICDSKGDIAYLVADIAVETSANLGKILEAIGALKENIRTRALENVDLQLSIISPDSKEFVKGTASYNPLNVKPRGKFVASTEDVLIFPKGETFSAVLKDSEGKTLYSTTQNTCDVVRRESLILHLDGSGNLYHFDFFQDCLAPGQKPPAVIKTVVFLARPNDGPRPDLMEPKEQDETGQEPMSFWQKNWHLLVPLLLYVLLSG